MTHDEALLKTLVSGLPDAKERRRYALLQAAATIRACYIDQVDNMHLDLTWCVCEAEQILAEIEKREKEG